MELPFNLPRCFCIAVLAASLPTAALADDSAEALLQKIQARADKIKEFRALLNNPDQTVRLAALDVMLKSSDVAMRELAYGVCFNSADQAMRGVCLINKMADLQTVAIRIDDIGDPTDSQKKALLEWGDNYVFTIENVDEKTGRFETKGSYRNGAGQIAGTGIEFAQNYCSGSFVLADGAELVGELGCRGGWAGTFPGRIRLQ
ncbi:MAG: hypothetical protein KDI82_00405 [Gammaproteobacteria bacterium]|nr:hypothetical protein [Gammaproteobacteria bacterium]